MKHIIFAFVHGAGVVMVILDLREDESMKNEGVACEVNRRNRSDTLSNNLYICCGYQTFYSS